MIRRAFLTLIAISLSLSPAHAQERSALILRPGEISLTVGGEHLDFRTLFANGENRPLAAGLGGPLTPLSFAPLVALRDSLDTFFAATDSVPFPVADADLLAGDLLVELGWNTRSGSGRIAVGILPRVEIGVAMSSYRTERFPRRLGLSGGLVGLNPDPVGNAALLQNLDESGPGLGRAPVLPIEGSATGAELQNRVFAATGDSLSLPEGPLTVAELATAFGGSPFPNTVSLFRPGDLEIDTRIELLRTFDGHYPANESAVGIRLALLGALRFATGDRGLENPLLDWGPEVGHGAFRLGVAADLFRGERFWASAGATMTRISPTDVRIATSFEPIPGSGTTIVAGRRSPGNELDLWLLPRLRLTEEFSIGGSYRFERQSEGADEVGGVAMGIAERARQSLGVTLRYTNLPAYDTGVSDFPLEAAVGFRRSISGSGGAAAAGVGFVQVSLLYQLWGERGRSASAP
jgi:hypothetical protein